MEILETVLSLLASALSIIATFLAFKNKKAIEELHDLYQNNKLTIEGKNNVQIVGTNNQAGNHDK